MRRLFVALVVVAALLPARASAASCAPPGDASGCPPIPFTGGDPNWRPTIPAGAEPSCGIPAPHHPCYVERGTEVPYQPPQQASAPSSAPKLRYIQLRFVRSGTLR